jgi:hypothetical protein
MKQFIVGLAIAILCTMSLCYTQDRNMHLRQLSKLKFVAEESAAAAAQYFDKVEYSEGRYVFNQVEGIKAAEYVMKYNLNLNDDFTPKSESYWTDKITYKIKFYDDLNTIYPFLYSDGGIALTIGSPTVIVEINAGKTRYRLMSSPPIAVRTAAHEWKSR